MTGGRGTDDRRHSTVEVAESFVAADALITRQCARGGDRPRRRPGSRRSARRLPGLVLRSSVWAKEPDSRARPDNACGWCQAAASAATAPSEEPSAPTLSGAAAASERRGGALRRRGGGCGRHWRRTRRFDSRDPEVRRPCLPRCPTRSGGRGSPPRSANSRKSGSVVDQKDRMPSPGFESLRQIDVIVVAAAQSRRRHPDFVELAAGGLRGVLRVPRQSVVPPGQHRIGAERVGGDRRIERVVDLDGSALASTASRYSMRAVLGRWRRSCQMPGPTRVKGGGVGNIGIQVRRWTASASPRKVRTVSSPSWKGSGAFVGTGSDWSGDVGGVRCKAFRLCQAEIGSAGSVSPYRDGQRWQTEAMATLRPRSPSPGRKPRRWTTIKEDLVTSVLALWLIAGLFVDGWAHRNLDGLETFFTPWHALFYSGFAATAACGWSIWSGSTRRVPVGYRSGIIGVGIFALGGVGDLIWHSVFGIEVSLDALLSPTHLAVADGHPADPHQPASGPPGTDRPLEPPPGARSSRLS